MSSRFTFAFAALLACSLAQATETITYTYNARGQLVKVVRTGTVNNNVQAQYTYDKANNRKTLAVTGSSRSTPP
jgi:YD repeat-containing protein